MNIVENLFFFPFFFFSTFLFLLLYPSRSLSFLLFLSLPSFLFFKTSSTFLFFFFFPSFFITLFSFLFFISSTSLSIYLSSLHYTNQFILNAKMRAYKIKKIKNVDTIGSISINNTKFIILHFNNLSTKVVNKLLIHNTRIFATTFKKIGYWIQHQFSWWYTSNKFLTI